MTKQYFSPRRHGFYGVFYPCPRPTNAVIPAMLDMALPGGGELLPRLFFRSAREFPLACRKARLAVDDHIRSAVSRWKSRP